MLSNENEFTENERKFLEECYYELYKENLEGLTNVELVDLIATDVLCLDDYLSKEERFDEVKNFAGPLPIIET